MPVFLELLLVSTSAESATIVMRPVPARYELKDTAVGVDGNLLQLKLVMDSPEWDRKHYFGTGACDLPAGQACCRWRLGG